MTFVIVRFLIEKCEQRGLYFPTAYVVGERIRDYLFPHSSKEWMSVNYRANISFDECGKENDFFYAKINININEGEFPESVCDEAREKFMNMTSASYYTDCMYVYTPKEIILSHYYEEPKEPGEYAE